MHVHLWRMLKIFSRNNSFSVFFFSSIPYNTPIRMTISPRNERIVRILHFIEQLQRHYLALDSAYFSVYMVSVRRVIQFQTPFSWMNTRTASFHATSYVRVRWLLYLCYKLIHRLANGQFCCLYILQMSERHHAAFVLHSNIVARIILRLCCM